ncbi:hypothetical protein FBEOM_1965 [Fusarium beomiforme]|uniref:RING-type domain-containing protein n=1 Tax=Fusarium beomiforme TaxID=44412 RepID=A0A9P5ASV7_9HYPO|nr:hypothetical protein FBEOM_1965 [Fusarium beomiforme]
MPIAYNASWQIAAQYQLEYILEYERENPEQDALPEFIHDLISVRPHLELVAQGIASFNEEGVNARVNKRFSAAEYPLEEAHGSSPSAMASAFEANSPITVAAGTSGELHEHSSATSNAATVASSSDSTGNAPATPLAAAPTRIFVSPSGFAPLDEALQDDSICDIYCDDNAGTPPKSPVVFETSKSNKNKISKVTLDALTFLHPAEVGHILEARAYDDTPSISSQEAVHGTPSKILDTSGDSLYETLSASEVPNFHHDGDEEGLISFDESPSTTFSTSSTIDGVQTPANTVSGVDEEVLGSDLAPGAYLVTQTLLLAAAMNATQTDEASPASPDATTSAAADKIFFAHDAESSAESFMEDAQVTSANSVHEDGNSVKCFKCGKVCVGAAINCPCHHRYCSDCVNDLVKSSIRGSTPFPPVCCELPVPVDINSDVFDEKTLHDYLCKKFEVPGSNGQDGDLPPSAQTEEGSEISLKGFGGEHENENKTRCRVCERVIEKDYSVGVIAAAIGGGNASSVRACSALLNEIHLLR